jgi:hypothetical protein
LRCSPERKTPGFAPTYWHQSGRHHGTKQKSLIYTIRKIATIRHQQSAGHEAGTV